MEEGDGQRRTLDRRFTGGGRRTRGGGFLSRMNTSREATTRGKTMLDATGTINTATMWQDKHSNIRSHKLMTKELGDTIPALYSNENVKDYDSVLALAKLFSPYTGWCWFITEWDSETGERFGLVQGFETGVRVFLPRRVGGVYRGRYRPRRGAGSVLAAEDPRRDQERTGIGLEWESRPVDLGY